MEIRRPDVFVKVLIVRVWNRISSLSLQLGALYRDIRWVRTEIEARFASTLDVIRGFVSPFEAFR